MTLPDCMMPDGADPCRGYHELRAEIERLKDEVRGHLKAWDIERAEIERLQAESDISDGLLADAKAEIERLRAADKDRVTVHEAEIRRMGIAMGEQADEIERLQDRDVLWDKADQDNRITIERLRGHKEEVDRYIATIAQLRAEVDRLQQRIEHLESRT
jgi:DNA repair exonuclease SbcCD ATPase subunit